MHHARSDGRHQGRRNGRLGCGAVVRGDPRVSVAHAHAKERGWFERGGRRVTETTCPPRQVRFNSLETSAGPSGAIRCLTSVSDVVPRASPSPPMPILAPAPPVNLSSAQRALPDNISVHTEDLDTSMFDRTLSQPVSVSSSVVSLPVMTPYRASPAASRSPSPPRQTSTPSVVPVPVLASATVGSFPPESTVGPFSPEGTEGPFRRDVVDKAVGPDEPMLDRDEGLIYSARALPQVFKNYDHERFGKLAGYLLEYFPVSSVEDLINYLRSRIPKNFDDCEFQCALNILRGVEYGQAILARRLRQTLSRTDVRNHQALLVTLVEVCRGLHSICHRPWGPTPSSTSTRSESAPRAGPATPPGPPPSPSCDIPDGPASPDPEEDFD